MEPTKTKEIGCYRIKIGREDSPDNPRNWDNLGTMVCFHGRYNLGDKHDYRSKDYSGWGEMKEAIMNIEDVSIILPLYLYDHSGITISTTPFSCPWDSGQIGFIYVSKKKVREEYGVKRITEKVRETALNVLKGEVETYDKYITGEVHRFEICEVKKCDEGHEHETFIDSCGGFYDEDECLSEAESVVNDLISQNKE